VLNGIAVLLENVTRHSLALLVCNGVLLVVIVRVLCRIIVVVRALESLSDEVVEHLLLLLAQAVVNVLNRLLCRVLSHVISFVVVIVCVLEYELFDAVIHDSRIIKLFNRAICMLESHIVDEGSRIGAREHEAHLSDETMQNVLALLHELVRVDRKRDNVSVLHGDLGTLSLGRRIEETARVDAVLSMFKDCLAKNVLRIIVSVLPNQRHSHLVLMLESVGGDRSTIGTLQVSLSSVTAEVSYFHFEVPL